MRIYSPHRSGGSSDTETPVPIPNTAVKRVSADDSRKVKVGHCQFIDLSVPSGALFRLLIYPLFCENKPICLLTMNATGFIIVSLFENRFLFS